jgi:hypothetical protein
VLLALQRKFEEIEMSVLPAGKRKLFVRHILTWNKVIPIILAVILLIAFGPVPAQAAGNVYYVAKNGSNSNPGTEAQPWLTIQKAASTLTAGDTVYVKAGTYREQVRPRNSGTDGNVITYAAYPGNIVIIDGTGLSAGSDFNGLFEISGTPYNYGGGSGPLNYITVDGFTLQNAKTSCGFATNGETHYITIKNCVIHDTKWCGISFNPNAWKYNITKGTYLTADNCELYNTNLGTGDESISIISVANFEIKNCKVHNTSAIAIDMKQGSTHGSCHDNEVYNTGSGIYIDARDADADSISIYNNVCHDISGSAGIIFESEQIGHGITNLTVYNNIVYDCNDGIYFGNYGSQLEYVSFVVTNNTLYNNNLGIILLQTYDHYTSGVIRNNIIAGTRSSQSLLSYAAYNDITHTDPGGHVIVDHNLFYNAAGYSSVNKYGTNYIQSNPLFVNPGADFSISAGSPAIDAGLSDSAPSFDYTDASRPQGAAYDIGAYEYQSGPSVEPQPQPEPPPQEPPPDQPPVLDPIGDQTVNTSQTLAFVISATDPDGDPLTYSASNLPPGSSFNASSRTFSWTPAANQAGTYVNVLFTVNDGSLTDYENITITVKTVNQAPILAAIGNKTVNAGQALTFTISASDPDGDRLTYSASNLPSGSIFNPTTRTFSWTPSKSQMGTYNITFSVTDGKVTTSKSITVTVKRPIVQYR